MPCLEPVSRAHTENPPHQRCHLSAGARDQSSCHSCTQLLNIPEAPPQDHNRVVFELIQFGNFSQQRTTVHRATGLPHGPPSETHSHHGRDGFHRIAAASVSQPLCGSVSDRAVGLELDMSVQRDLAVRCAPFALGTSPLPVPSPDERVPRGRLP